MGATEVDVALRDGSHAELVVGPGEECGEGAGKHDITVTHSTTYRHTHLQDRRDEAETSYLMTLTCNHKVHTFVFSEMS